MTLGKDPRLWIAGLSALAVLFLVLGDVGRESPGNVARAHARVEALNGGENCAACHGGWFHDMAAACLDCHEIVKAQIAAGEGLHGRLGKSQVAECAVCHSDHNGTDFQLVNRQSFAVAGVPHLDKFDHRMVGFAMAGKHIDLACSACHEHADALILPAGGRRFGGLQQRCASCHEDAHEGRMVLACATCHSQTDFKDLAAFGHDEHLPLIGGHADVACAQCHQKTGSHSLDALGAGSRIRGKTPTRTCVDCHTSPHSSHFIPAAANRKNACLECHEHSHETFAQDALQLTKEQHARSGFQLGQPHDEVACAKCHDPKATKFADRYPGRKANDCQRCHEDPHGGQFDKGKNPKACVECHATTHFAPHAFTAEKHSQVGLALTGRHLEAECSACHEAQKDQPRRFRGTPVFCQQCHEDAHEGYFDSRLAKPVALNDSNRGHVQAALAHGKCALCHTTKTFSKIPEGLFDHGQWTGFAVLGAHAQVDCVRCHERGAEPDRFGRTFGRIKRKKGKPATCDTCHQDPHRGVFDLGPRVVDGRMGCARCHDEASFRTLPHGFAHGKWTGFVLDGAHEAADCSKCHEPMRRPDKLGRTWQAARGKNCASCHQSPHGGQFAKRGTTDCRHCHQSASSFRNLSFRHNLDSRFPLGEQHRTVACKACHKPEQKGQASFVRYKPLPTKCIDCHGSAQGPFKKRKRRQR